MYLSSCSSWLLPPTVIGVYLIFLKSMVSIFFLAVPIVSSSIFYILFLNKSSPPSAPIICLCFFFCSFSLKCFSK